MRGFHASACFRPSGCARKKACYLLSLSRAKHLVARMARPQNKMRRPGSSQHLCLRACDAGVSHRTRFAPSWFRLNAPRNLIRRIRFHHQCKPVHELPETRTPKPLMLLSYFRALQVHTPELTVSLGSLKVPCKARIALRV